MLFRSEDEEDALQIGVQVSRDADLFGVSIVGGLARLGVEPRGIGVDVGETIDLPLQLVFFRPRSWRRTARPEGSRQTCRAWLCA